MQLYNEHIERNISCKKILITGGTGSLGQPLAKRLLEFGASEVRIFSRDEAKQWEMKQKFASDRLKFYVGDIRNQSDLFTAIKDVDIVFNAAALKQVPNCEYFPFQAVQTNIIGAENIVQLIEQHNLLVQTVVGISTDKACSPINAMGISKAMQEKIFIAANLRCKHTRFVCARYGNILGSRGSLVPLFKQQIAEGKPLTVTSNDMTRFLMTLDEAIYLILKAATMGNGGDIFLPKPIAAQVIVIAKIFSNQSGNVIEIVGIRPGEKLDESLFNEEEAVRLAAQDEHNIIVSGLVANHARYVTGAGSAKPSSKDNLTSPDAVYCKLFEAGLV